MFAVTLRWLPISGYVDPLEEPWDGLRSLTLPAITLGLALAAVIPVSGWAAGRFGAKRLWVASVVLFTLGSALSGLAWSTETLVIFRVLQGIGGGMIMPVGTMMLTRAAGPARAAARTDY